MPSKAALKNSAAAMGPGFNSRKTHSLFVFFSAPILYFQFLEINKRKGRSQMEGIVGTELRNQLL